MSQKSVVALACLSALVIGGFVIAEDGVAVFQRADGTIEVEPTNKFKFAGNGLIEAVAVGELGEPALKSRTVDLDFPQEVTGVTEAGPFQVVAVGDSAILLNVNSGDTWRLLRDGNNETWTPIPRIGMVQSAD